MTELTYVRQFEERRKPLVKLAYRMLGSIVEAEDIVQDAFLRWHAVHETGSVDNSSAYLTTIVTRLCLDRQKSAEAKRLEYVGAWLPEPVVDPALTAEQGADLANDLSLAFLLMLERLSPLERAAFLLHDTFDLDFESVSKVLGRSSVACRKLAARARAHIRSAPSRYPVSEQAGVELADAFKEASRSGSVAKLEKLLARDVVLFTDGGGKRPAALNPILGANNVARFFAGLVNKFGYRPLPDVAIVRINGLSGFVSTEVGGVLQSTTLEFADHLISGIYIVRNPDKLGHIACDVPASPPERSPRGATRPAV